MKELSIKPEIYTFDKCEEFVDKFKVGKEELKEFTENVMTKQGRLIENNYTQLTKETVYKIYESLY